MGILQASFLCLSSTRQQVSKVFAVRGSDALGKPNLLERQWELRPSLSHQGALWCLGAFDGIRPA